MSNFTSSEIEIILNNLNNMTFYQFVKQLNIKDSEVQEEVHKLLTDKNPNHKQKNEKRLRYLIKSYLLEHISPSDLINFYASLENPLAQNLFDPIRLRLMEIMENTKEYIFISNQISTLEEKCSSIELKDPELDVEEAENELEKLYELSSLYQSNIELIYKDLDIPSKKALLNKLLIDNSINIIEIIWQYTDNDLKKEFLPSTMMYCSNTNQIDTLISFYKNTPIEIKTAIDKDLKLASLAFEATKKTISEAEKIKSASNLFWKGKLYNLIKIFLSIPKEQRESFSEEFFSIFERINNITNLDYNQQLQGLLKYQSLNLIEVLELFQDKINFENDICLNIDNLTEESINKLNALAEKNCSFSLNFTIRSAADLSAELLKKLDPRIKVQEIRFKDTNLTYWQEQPYTLEQYIECREKIDSILDGIDLTRNPNDPDCEKKIFGKIIRRLANLITYDYDLCKKIDDETIEPSESFQCASMLGALTLADDTGNGLAVCSGFSETARNVFKCCGIDILVVSGVEKTIKYVDGEEKEKLEGHQWNLIKLDGQWYWMDLTWARNDIVRGLTPTNLLKSDQDFQNHLNVFNEGTKLKSMVVYPAPETIPSYKLKTLLYPQDESRKKEIHTVTRRVRRSRIRETVTALENFQPVPAVSKENKGDEYGD